MINPYRPTPPAPPPAPARLPVPQAVAPAAPALWALPAQVVRPQPRSPVGALGLPLDPLSKISTTLVGSPITALVGAAIGFAIAGPLGAARGALLGGTLPGTLLAAHEFHLTNPWWGKEPTRSGWGFLAILGIMPALSTAGFGVGLAVAGATGAAWGTLIAVGAPILTMLVVATVIRWTNPPVYDPPAVVPGTPGAPVPRAALPLVTSGPHPG